MFPYSYATVAQQATWQKVSEQQAENCFVCFHIAASQVQIIHVIQHCCNLLSHAESHAPFTAKLQLTHYMRRYDFVTITCHTTTAPLLKHAYGNTSSLFLRSQFMSLWPTLLCHCATVWKLIYWEQKRCNITRIIKNTLVFPMIPTMSAFLCWSIQKHLSKVHKSQLGLTNLTPMPHFPNFRGVT